MLKRQSVYRIVFRLVSTSLFIVLAGFIILKLTGSQLNIRAGKLQPTGIIRIYSLPKAAAVAVKGSDYSGSLSTPANFSNLTPGWYEVTVTKEGYQTWSKTVNVEPGKAAVLDDVVLILQSPIPTDFKTEKVGELAALYDPKDYPNLTVKNETEIWQQDRLITRLSKPVSLVRWFPDEKHLTYVSEGAIWLIDLDGGGTQKIMNFTSQDYLITENGRSVLIEDKDGIKKFVIRT